MTGLRERKKTETRRQLMYAAIGLFAERGFDHVTVEDIAAAANVSPSTFFRYFESKAGVVFGMSTARLEAMQAALDDRPEHMPALDVIRDYWLEQIEAVKAAPDVFHGQQELAERYQAVAGERSRVYDVGRAVMARALRQEFPDATAVDTEMVASVMVSAVFTAMRVWHEQGGDLREIFAACWRLVEVVASAQRTA